MATAADATGPGSECDVVMKGGITSEVIYPRLLSTLSKIHRLGSFGGTSAGAIAAAAGAAAQLSRLTGNNCAAFATLDQLPKALGDVERGASDSTLLRLFQPQQALGLVFAGVGAVVGAIAGAVLCLARELPRNDFGLCNGMPGVAGDGEPRAVDLAVITTGLNAFFSDGGICSNFPIHFFDVALPTRPTFGVDLRPFHPDHPEERVRMPAAGSFT